MTLFIILNEIEAAKRVYRIEDEPFLGGNKEMGRVYFAHVRGN